MAAARGREQGHVRAANAENKNPQDDRRRGDCRRRVCAARRPGRGQRPPGRHRAVDPSRSLLGRDVGHGTRAELHRSRLGDLRAGDRVGRAGGVLHRADRDGAVAQLRPGVRTRRDGRRPVRTRSGRVVRLHASVDERSDPGRHDRPSGTAPIGPGARRPQERARRTPLAALDAGNGGERRPSRRVVDGRALLLGRRQRQRADHGGVRARCRVRLLGPHALLVVALRTPRPSRRDAARPGRTLSSRHQGTRPGRPRLLRRLGRRDHRPHGHLRRRRHGDPGARERRAGDAFEARRRDRGQRRVPRRDAAHDDRKTGRRSERRVGDENDVDGRREAHHHRTRTDRRHLGDDRTLDPVRLRVADQ